MNVRTIRFSLSTALVLIAVGTSPTLAEDYVIDASHSAATFQVPHLGLSWTSGRFNSLSGTVSTNPATFTLVAKTDSIDTGNAQRDEHLKSPDFFNAKQFPEISFKSTSVRPATNGYEVTGELSLHGVTRPVTIQFLGGKEAEFPAGVYRTGFTGKLVIKRSTFGIDKFQEMVGDEVQI